MTYLIYCAGAEILLDLRRDLSGRARRGGLARFCKVCAAGRPHPARSGPATAGSGPDAQARYRCLAGRTKEACAVPPAMWTVPAVLAGVRVAVARLAVRLRTPSFRVPLPVKIPVWTPASEGVKAPPVDDAPPHELAPPPEDPVGALAPEWVPPPPDDAECAPVDAPPLPQPAIASPGAATASATKKAASANGRPKTRNFASGRWSTSDPPADSMEPQP